MRPITDDVVLGLMKGLETREKRALAKRAVAVAEVPPQGSMTSRILPFVRIASRATGTSAEAGSVASLGEASKRRRISKTSRGLFSYISAE